MKAMIHAALFAALTSPVMAEQPGASILQGSKQAYPTAVTDYGYQRVRGFARMGDRSHRFEIRHGDCGRDRGWQRDINSTDCERDRQRIERKADSSRMQSVGQQVWYGWSMYLPSDFRDLGRGNTTVGQVKLTRWGPPLWMLNLRQGRIITDLNNDAWCEATSYRPLLGKWTDITVFADYSYAPEGESFAIYINGRKFCSNRRPLITQAMVQKSRSLGSRGSLYFKWGIYNSFVSRWLNANKRHAPVEIPGANKLPLITSERMTSHELAIESPTKAPFAFDWGVQLPTQVIFYDEMRYGSSRAQVDVQMLEQMGATPVD